MNTSSRRSLSTPFPGGEWSDSLPGTIAKFSLLIALTLGAYVRLDPVLRADFPLNDGGLFVLLAQEIRDAHGRLPFFSSYNAAQIPFTYPPLPFYAAAFLSNLFGWSLLSIVRIAPAVISILTLPALYALALSVLRSRRQACFAVLLFSLLPFTYDWFIMGGGLTRSPGLLFAILTLQQASRLYSQRQPAYIATTASFAALTVLCHPPATWCVVYSLVLFAIVLGRDRQGFGYTAFTFISTLLLTSPWWILMLSRHGLEPYAEASRSGRQGGALSDILPHLGLGDESHYWPYVLVALLLYALAFRIRKQALVPFWLTMMVLLNPRGGAPFIAVPLALLTGIALDHVLQLRVQPVWVAVLLGIVTGLAVNAGVIESWRQQLGYTSVVIYLVLLLACSRFIPVARRKGQSPPHQEDGSSRNDEALQPQGVNCSPLLLPIYLVAAASLAAIGLMQTALPLRVLPLAEREAMQWIARNTSPHSSFVVLPRSGWAHDRASEWFPVLAQRVSVATVQGYEWRPHGAFFLQNEKFGTLKALSGSTPTDLKKWARDYKVTFSHIYVPQDGAVLPDESGKELWISFERKLRASPDYRIAFSNSGATIFARRH